MRRQRLTLVIAAGLLASLPGCVTAPATPTVDRSTLAAICPVPTRWARAEMIEVADALEHAAGEPGISRIAAEWERLNDAAKICRSEK